MLYSISMKNIITILSFVLLLSLSFARTSGKYSMPDSFTQIKEVPKSEYVPGSDGEDNSLKWKRRHKRRKKARNRKPERGR